MTQAAATTPTVKDYFDALACPSCCGQLILTKEKIIFCQKCYLGFRIVMGIPDLRLAQSVSFKKKIGGAVGVNAALTVTSGERLNEGFRVALHHCVLIGRSLAAGDTDLTVAGKLQVHAPLDGHTQSLIEKFLARKGKPGVPAGLSLRNATQVGDFERDPDFTLSDSSVSRQHAILYQDREGLWVLDLVSKNGTFVNGREVECGKLRSGDTLRIGNVTLRVNFV